MLSASAMDREERNRDKQNSGDHIVADVKNGGSERSTTIHSEEAVVSWTMNRSESHPRSSSSSSSTSSKDFMEVSKDFLEVNSDKETNSRTGEPDVSPTKSPSIQVMDRNGGYDPNRIPASVFERSKSNTPADWSCASNESLFSIHVGNNSFTTRDFTQSSDLFKSGELLTFSPGLASPMEQQNEETAASEEEEAEGLAEVKKESEEEMSEHPAVSCKSATTSCHSNQSANSTKSFSFPILAKDTVEAPNKEGGEQNAQPAQATTEANQSPASNRWFPCLPPCPWCCSSSGSCCSCF